MARSVYEKNFLGLVIFSTWIEKYRHENFNLDFNDFLDAVYVVKNESDENL